MQAFVAFAATFITAMLACGPGASDVVEEPDALTTDAPDTSAVDSPFDEAPGEGLDSGIPDTMPDANPPDAGDDLVPDPGADVPADPGGDPGPFEYAVKVINMPMTVVLTHLDRFAARGLTLYLNVQPEHIGDPDFAEVLKQAKAKGVPVRLWPLLRPEDGAWCNEDNLDHFRSNLLATLDFVMTVDHDVSIVVINSELGPPKIDLIRQYFAEGKWGDLIDLLTANTDPVRFAQSVAKVSDMVDQIHARGFQAQITTYPYLLDDLVDGDRDIQDAANVVLDGVAWDRLAFTPYTAAYSQDFGMPFGPEFVHSYARSARERYGDKVDIALGLIAPGSPGGFKSVADLAADVAAAKAAGVRRIDVFDLQGMLADDRFDEWADALLTEPLVPTEDPNTTQFREQMGMADQVLDSLHPSGALAL